MKETNMNAKLTANQKRALAKLSESEGRCAFEIKESLSTLNALAAKGFARSKHYIGSVFSPRVNIEWFKTAATIIFS